MRSDEKIKSFNWKVKQAIGGNAKKLQYEFEKLGWKRRLQWIYQQGENIDGRQSIIESFLTFMIALKNTDQKSFEFLWYELSIFLGMKQIQIDADVEEFFPDSKSVNEALRFLIRITKEHKSELPKK